MKNYGLIIALLLIISCEFTTKKQERAESDFFIALKDSLVKEDFKDLNIIKIRKIKRNTSIINHECDNWKINEKAIKKFLKIAVPISDAELHYLYNQEECAFEGEFIYKKEIYEFEINGGGWIDILSKKNDSSLILGCNLILCENIFVSRGNLSDEE